MSFPVAFQSAVFYIVACTPCAKVRHRHKVKELAKKERLEKARLETEQPGLYRHPSPFNTNPYWQEEIDMGPSLPKKSISKNSSQRGLTSSGGQSCAQSESERTNLAASRTTFGDSLSITREEDDFFPPDWNRKRGYQREDEELWGQWSGNKIKDAFSKARGSAGRLIESTLGLDKEVSEQERQEFYTTPRNPPVNDYHPPVVSSKAPRKDAHKWMLQPPPPAKIMEGKVPVSRAVSSGSKSSGTTLVGEEVQLCRIVQERAMQERKRSMNPTESELIDSLFVTRSNQLIPKSRSLSFDGTEEALDNPFEWQRRTRSRPMSTPPGWEADDDEDEGDDTASSAFRRPKASLPLNLSAHAAQRPRLETILSADGSISSRDAPKKAKRQRSKRNKVWSGVGSPVGDDTD